MENDERELLQQCAARGQMSSAQAVSHSAAGELPAQMVGAEPSVQEEQSEALRLADVMGNFQKSSHRWTNGQPIHIAVSSELRRLHAENADLRAQLEAVGAGGVSALIAAPTVALPAEPMALAAIKPGFILCLATLVSDMDGDEDAENKIKFQEWIDSEFENLPEEMTADVAINNAIAAFSAPTAQAEPADPMDWPLPCDVVVGHGTMRKGVKLSSLVARMKTLYEMATGHNADEVAARTPEQRRAIFDKAVLDLSAQAERPEPAFYISGQQLPLLGKTKPPYLAYRMGREGLFDTAVYFTPVAPEPADPVALPVTNAMIDAYLTAQRRYVEEADRQFGRPNVGGLHTSTVREACRSGLVAAIAAKGQA